MTFYIFQSGCNKGQSLLLNLYFKCYLHQMFMIHMHLTNSRSHDLHMTTCFHFCLNGAGLMPLHRPWNTADNVSSPDLDYTFHLEPIVDFKMHAISTMVSKITFDSAIKMHYFSQWENDVPAVLLHYKHSNNWFQWCLSPFPPVLTADVHISGI